MLRLKALTEALLEKNRELEWVNKELERRRSELLELTRTDSLTGLFNRRYFEERLALEYSRALRYGGQLSLVMVDIDHFKRINDTWGHPFGDVVLKRVAQVARESLRDVDMLARYGGEELVVLLPETAAPDAMVVCERVRSAIERLELTAPGEAAQAVHVTASLGLATFPQHGLTGSESLVRAADDCLYEAKAGGRNRVVQRPSPLPAP
jgi:two-component system, cell cycle response regulator